MRPIGGFFDLEIPPPGIGPHPGAVALSTGRACIALWIREARPARCYVPFYCCNALFEPLQAAGIPFEFYALDPQLYPIGLPQQPERDEWLVWTNFFGVLASRLAPLVEAWGGRVLVDNTHAFFDADEPGLWSFTSARKYFGVPDGAYCYRPDRDPSPPDVERFIPHSVHHLVARYTERSEDAFGLYQAAEAALDCSLQRISVFAEQVLAAVDIESVRASRASNLAILVDALGGYNTFGLADLFDEKPVFCYPFLPPRSIPRSNLYAQNLFIPTLWPDIPRRADNSFDLELRLSEDLLPLPIDHRYGAEDMERIINIICGPNE